MHRGALWRVGALLGGSLLLIVGPAGAAAALEVSPESGSVRPGGFLVVTLDDGADDDTGLGRVTTELDGAHLVTFQTPESRLQTCVLMPVDLGLGEHTLSFTAADGDTTSISLVADPAADARQGACSLQQVDTTPPPATDTTTNVSNPGAAGSTGNTGTSGTAAGSSGTRAATTAGNRNAGTTNAGSNSGAGSGRLAHTGAEVFWLAGLGGLLVVVGAFAASRLYRPSNRESL